jgi:hypothetical protein
MTFKRPSDFLRSKATGTKGLRQKLRAAERHIRDAETIGWPALAESWRRDADAIKRRLDELGAAHALARRRVAELQRA